ncbi:response regulator transcription factor [Shewanella loihica]|uniref:Two component transcriptional regulator, LuxR family n=1 Tax=Shewanella loihica (strain ATCC BAA-1088 / PV-4) TaxID=323850 RepID=A3QED7_SHELP|nr:response regulator [Shewanella loihica]ABO23835.1 two component transcriptional regulator, LuxR family [Shewanella loihica PV-4]
MCNLYLVDDDQDVLDSLKWMLEGMGYAPQTFTNASCFLTQVDLHLPGVAILDIQMPGVDGIELLQQIKQQDSPLSVIMLTGHGTISMAVQALQHGAIDFLEKPADGDKLQALMKKASLMSLDAYQHKEKASSVAQRIASLTPREQQVMHAVLAGKLNKVIAAELNIAQRTIELHRQKVMQKMQVNNVAELAYLMAITKP